MHKLLIGGALLALSMVPNVSASAAPAGGAAINDAAQFNPIVQGAACRRITRCVTGDEGRRCRTIIRCGDGDRDWRRRDRDRDRDGRRDRRPRDRDDD